MTSLRSHLSDDEWDALADLLDARSRFDTQGLLGVLHAAVVAPTLLPPSQWIPVVFPRGFASSGIEEAQASVGLVMRLYNQVLSMLNSGRVLMPEEDDVDGCESFARGFVAAAELDPVWTGDDAHWTFASWAAFLCRRHELVPAKTMEALSADAEQTRSMFRRDMGGIVVAAHERFCEVRRDALAAARRPEPVRAMRVGRNEPCPCGSGKKFKRCCIDRVPTAPS